MCHTCVCFPITFITCSSGVSDWSTQVCGAEWNHTPNAVWFNLDLRSFDQQRCQTWTLCPLQHYMLFFEVTGSVILKGCGNVSLIKHWVSFIVLQCQQQQSALQSYREHSPNQKSCVCAAAVGGRTHVSLQQEAACGVVSGTREETRQQWTNCKALTAALVTNQMNTESKSENALSLKVSVSWDGYTLNKTKKILQNQFSPHAVGRASRNQLHLKHHSQP